MCKAEDALAGLRERKKVETRDAIVAAALDLFDHQGYDATTVEQIADAANVSPRTFFRYFDSKVEVVMAPKEQRAELTALLRARPDEESPVEAIRQVIHETLGQMLAADPTQVRQMHCMLSTESLQATAREHFNEEQADMAREFARRLGLAEDALEAQVMAAAIGTTIWTVATRWIGEGSDPHRLFDMLDQALDLLAAGLDPKAP